MAVWDTNEYGKGKWGQGKGVEEGMGGWITVVGRKTTVYGRHIEVTAGRQATVGRRQIRGTAGRKPTVGRRTKIRRDVDRRRGAVPIYGGT